MPSPIEARGEIAASRTKKTVVLALFVVLTFATGMAESLLPLPLPGVRLGAANIFPLAALLLFGAREAAAVAAARLVLAFFLTGNPFALVCSAAGLVCSLPLSILLYSKFRESLSVSAISVASAEAFNLGQVAAAILLTSAPALLVYSPLIMATGAATGYAVGRLAETLCERLKGTTTPR
jgi:heptaprenyl diphosphate synthase